PAGRPGRGHQPPRLPGRPPDRRVAARLLSGAPFLVLSLRPPPGPWVSWPVVVPERLRQLVGETAELASLFDAAGYRLYLVGGVVRDAVLGRLSDQADLDFTTDARPDEIERIVRAWADAVWTQGKRFGTIGLRAPASSGAGAGGASRAGVASGAAAGGGRTMEITTHRAEAYRPDSRKPE